MNVTDPISDMLTRIRNAEKAKHDEVPMPSSKMKAAIAEVLKETGYITDYTVSEQGVPKLLTLQLKYLPGKTPKPVIERLERISKPSRRVYVNSTNIPRVLGGLGIAILSTSQGIMCDRDARQKHIGGEVLCYVW